MNDKPHTVSRARQQEILGRGQIVSQDRGFVQPLPQAHPITPAEASVIEGGLNLARGILGIPTTHHARSDDTAVSHAVASLVYSAAYAMPAGLVTTGILIIAWLAIGWPGGHRSAWYMLAGLIAWGISLLVALHHNRMQGLRHSAAGVGLAEVDARENVATTAVIEHNKSLRYKWTIEYVERTGKEPPAIEID